MSGQTRNKPAGLRAVGISRRRLLGGALRILVLAAACLGSSSLTVQKEQDRSDDGFWSDGTGWVA